MKKSSSLLYVLLLSALMFVAGHLFPTLAILDTTFGLPYYVSDILGAWRPGPSWIRENRVMFFLLFLVSPAVISFLFSGLAVFFVKRAMEKNTKVGIAAIILLIVLFIGFQSSVDGRISFALYHSSNF